MKLVPIDDKYKSKMLEWHKIPEIADCIGLWGEYSDYDLVCLVEGWTADEKTVIFGIDEIGKPVGYIMIKNLDRVNGVGEIHITMSKKSIKTAYMAYEAILNHAFNKLGLNRVYTYCLGHRKDIMKMMNKNLFGFKSEGCLRQAIKRENEYIDVYIYGLLKGEFICQPQ